MGEKLIILHTNDLHSHFENWPRVRRFLISQRRANLAKGNTVITLDLGDAMDRVHPLSEATDGQANVELLNQAHYDGVTIGNNEGLGNTKYQLDHLYDKANFDVILANLVDQQTGKLPRWAIPDKLVETAQGTRVLLVGLTAPYTLTYPLVGFQPLDAQEALAARLKENEGRYDCVILLSHLGLEVDQSLAQEFPELTVIVGAHTHHLLVEGEQVNQTTLAAAGKYGQYVGTVEVDFDEKHRVQTAHAFVTKTETLPTLQEDRAEIMGYEVEGESILAHQLVAQLPLFLESSWEHPSALLTEGLNSLTEYAKTDAAILNGGLFLTDLIPGIITQKDIHELLPHAMHVMKVTLTGDDLVRLIREMEKNRHFLTRFPIKGMGFRGQLFGTLGYSGIKYVNATNTVLWGEEAIVADRLYTVAMPDHYLFIPFFPTIELAGQNEIMYDELLRTVFGDYLSRKYPIRKED